MAINLESRTYNRTLDSLTAITYVIAPSGTMTAYVPFSATSFNAENSEVYVDSQGALWCEVRGMQKYGLADNIYLLILKFDKFLIYDSLQSDTRSAIITGLFATKNKNMSFTFEFKITQVACEARPGSLTGDIVLYRLDGSNDVLYKIEERDPWSGFKYCTNNIQSTELAYSKLKIRHCNNLGYFYRNQTKLTTFLTEDCNFSGVTSFNSMFYGCESLTGVSMSDWDMSSASTIESMFEKCKSLTGVTFPENSLGNCRNMSSVFSNCTALTSVDIRGINSSNATAMMNMFSNCQSLEYIDVSTLDVSNCTTMVNMFSKCTSLKRLDLTSWDVSNCTNFSGMFTMCQELTNIIGGMTEICGTSVMKGASQSIDVSTTNLDLASIVAIFTGVAEVSEGSGVYIKLSRAQWTMARGYFSIAEKKNWTITQASR